VKPASAKTSASRASPAWAPSTSGPPSDSACAQQSTFKRRFRTAPGETTISYVQRIRVERAKRALETGSAPIEEISWAVGYEDPASFRRLFKRLTGLTAGEYRRRFRLPRSEGQALWPEALRR
jgi:transcriptional regulator GlxA family with amidase domain